MTAVDPVYYNTLILTDLPLATRSRLPYSLAQIDRMLESIAVPRDFLGLRLNLEGIRHLGWVYGYHRLGNKWLIFG